VGAYESGGELEGILSETVAHYFFVTCDSSAFSLPSSTSFKTSPHRSEIVPSAAWFARAVVTSVCTLSISCLTLSRVARRILTVANSCRSHQHLLEAGRRGGTTLRSSASSSAVDMAWMVS
jgi:hypothetical protein